MVATAAAVAATAHGLGLAWGPAWVLGGAVAPTDATAVGVLARALPRRTVTVLRAESLVNDGTALVVYGLAVGVTVGEEHLSALHVSWLVVLAYGGGLLAGRLVGAASWQLRSRLDDPVLENIAILLTPFGAFLFAWLYTTPYLIRAVDRRPAQRLRRIGARQRMVTAHAGFRGAVSLAAALAVPRHLDPGAPFPDRDLIVVVTSGAIVVTLLQALLLPAVVRAARLPVDTSVDDERHLAELATSDAALESLEQTARELGTSDAVADRVRHELEKRRKLLAAAGAADDPVVQHDDQYTAWQLALIARKRSTLLELRDQQQIDDIVLRQIEIRT